MFPLVSRGVPLEVDLASPVPSLSPLCSKFPSPFWFNATERSQQASTTEYPDREAEKKDNVNIKSGIRWK